MRFTVAALLVAVAAGCGTSSPPTAAELRSCIEHALPKGFTPAVSTSVDDGVTSLVYTEGGAEAYVTVFDSVEGAKEAEESEARLGDAHDRRIRNVLYSGGGPVETATVACLH
jgi:hypothetical protein